MGLFSTMNTAISGMAAQSNKLSTVGDNIANSATTGYKRASTEFETLLGIQSTSDYQSGGVQTRVRYGIAEQGTIQSTTSVTDLAISGNGFFLVEDATGSQAMTRAGSFVPNANGDLVNAAGYRLLGTDLTAGDDGTLSAVNISTQALSAQPSTTGTLSVNLPSSSSAVPAGNLPSTNRAGATYTAKTSLVAYDNLGTAVTLDIYLTKTGSNSWQAAVFNHANAASGGSFPYAGGALANQNLTFDASTGAMTGTTSLSLTVPNGGALSIDMSKTTQLASEFSVVTGTLNGRSPSTLDHVSIGTDGVVTAVYGNGMTANISRIAMANVESPNNLTPLTGNVYVANTQSGQMVIGSAETGAFGKIDSSALESSTVDLATELTSMITAQRSYEANSKVLTTSSDMLSVIINSIKS